MNIEEKYFRNYHKLIGGEFKDLWHEWLHYFDDNIFNGSINNMEMGDTLESKIEWIESEGKEWLKPYIEAVYRVWEKNEIEYVRYYW